MTAYYGLRRSEMLGIKWSNIDFKQNRIVLNHSVIQTRLNGSIIVAKDKMKNSASLRTLPLISNVRNLLYELKQKQEENKERQEEIDIPKPRHLNSYKHRNNTKTIDIDENQVQNIPSIDEELAYLDRLIKMKEELLKKK